MSLKIWKEQNQDQLCLLSLVVGEKKQAKEGMDKDLMKQEWWF